MLLSDGPSEDAIAQLDLFDRLQLQSVIAVCRASSTLSDGVANCLTSRVGKKPWPTMQTGCADFCTDSV